MSNPHQDALQNTFEGFDFARPQDTKKSAKDSFAHHSKLAGRAPTEDKAALGAWFQEKVRPGMQADGHNVTDAQGDKFRFNNWQGDFWTDFGRGAGAPGGALAWQAEDANQPPQASGRQGQAIAPLMAGQSDLMAQILASLGLQEPAIDVQALLQQQLR
jgi:hypothetical protein